MWMGRVAFQEAPRLDRVMCASDVQVLQLSGVLRVHDGQCLGYTE